MHRSIIVLNSGYIAGIMQKDWLTVPEMRDNDTKTIKVCADRNKLCPGTYMPSSLGGRSVSVNRQAVRQILLQFDNFNLVTSKA